MIGPMHISFLPPLAVLSLVGCADVHEHPNPQPAATVVAPAPIASYVAPPTSTTVVHTS